MKGKKAKAAKWKDNDEDSDNVYDEIDRFRMEEDDVSDTERVSAKRRREEVLNVEGDTSDGEEAGENYDEYESEEPDFDSPEEEEKLEDALPSADRWSKKKSQFYNTSYVDEDWGGMNESDAELAEMEEQDAAMRQKKLDATLAFMQREERKAEEATEEPAADAAAEVRELTEEEKLSRFAELNPEFGRMLEEYLEKRRVLTERLSPLKSVIDANAQQRNTVLGEQIHIAYRVFASYLLNTMFYFRMKLTTGLRSTESKQYLEDHPVIDSIIKQKKMVMKVEEYLDKNKKALDKLVRLHKVGSSLKNMLESSGFVEKVNKTREASKNVPDTAEEAEIGDDVAMEGYGEEDEAHNEKRAISSEIQKNKGLATKRKKGTQHSRVKKRKQYEKALIKKRSQRPDVRREIEPYGGEKRGIRISTVKSVKLKA